MPDQILTWPFLGLQIGWVYLVVAQLGFFIVAFAVYLLWPKHPRWLTREYTVLAPTGLLAALLLICVIVLTINAHFPN